jgi:hypothetical protein
MQIADYFLLGASIIAGFRTVTPELSVVQGFRITSAMLTYIGANPARPANFRLAAHSTAVSDMPYSLPSPK